MISPFLFLMLIYFQLECEYDRVVVYHKRPGGQLKKQGAYCGPHLPPLITSEGNALRIEFYSDLSVQRSGFAAVFLTGMSVISVLLIF